MVEIIRLEISELARAGANRFESSILQHHQIKTPPKTVAFLFGGDEEDRTLDLRIANATLSQLSYIPELQKYSSANRMSASNTTPV